MSNFCVPFLVGNIFKRDHQYWPTITRDDLRAGLALQGITDANQQNRFMDRRWPVPVSLEVLMMMAWRVREWKIEASSFTYTGFKSSPVWTWTISGTLPEMRLKMMRVKIPPDVDNPLREVRDERDMLGPYTDRNLAFSGDDPWKTLRNDGVSGFVEPSEIELTAGNTGPPGEIDLAPPFIPNTANYEGSIFGTYVIFDPDTKLFFLPINVNGIFLRLHQDPGVEENFGASVDTYLLPVTPIATPDVTPPSGVAADVQQGTLTITGLGPDITVPIGMFGQPAGRNPPFWLSYGTGTINLTMAPISWWPFKNSLGQPVYDEVDGHQINNPHV